MKIEKIVLKNFSCYFGIKEFLFSEGINLVNGGNNSGKSKLFNAFYWVFTDTIYNEETERFIETLYATNMIISKKAINEFRENVIECSVTIYVSDAKKDEKYKIERKIISKPPHENTGLRSSLIIKLTDKNLETKTVDPTQNEKTLDTLLPPTLRKYMWFKGERLRNVVNFQNEEALLFAINALSNIKRFDDIADITSTVKDNINRDYSRIFRVHNQKKQKQEDIEKEIKGAQDGKIELESKLQQLSKSIRTTDHELSGLLQIAVCANQLKNIQNEIDRDKEKLKSVVEKLENLENSLVDTFFSNCWLLLGTIDYHKEFLNAFSNLEKEYLGRTYISDRFQLPVDMPNQHQINRMLEEEKCFVCDRSSPRDSDSWKFIESQANRKSQVQVIPNSDFYLEMRNLFTNSTKVEELIENIENDKRNVDEKTDELTKEKELYKESINTNKQRQQNLTLDFPGQKEEVDIYVAKHEQLTNALDTLKTNYSQKKIELEMIDATIKNKNEELTKLVPQFGKTAVAKKKAAIDKLYEIVQEVKAIVFEKNLKRIEFEANIQLKNMLKYFDPPVLPKIKIEKKLDGYIPIIYNEDGTVFESPNRSLLDAVYLALIMAIVKARVNTSSKYKYPLIADALTSTADVNLAKGFLETINSTFDQSIIIFKDILGQRDLAEWYKNDEIIKKGNNYLITIAKEEGVQSIHDQSCIETIIHYN